MLVAIPVNSNGYRKIVDVPQSANEDKGGCNSFLGHLKGRGLREVKLFISDKYMGLIDSLGEYSPEARCQRCPVQFYRNVFTVVPKGKVREVAAMLKAIHAQENREQALAKASYLQTGSRRKLARGHCPLRTEKKSAEVDGHYLVVLLVRCSPYLPTSPSAAVAPRCRKNVSIPSASSE